MYESSVLAPETLSVFKKLAPLVDDIGFVLAGGTALALQIGHRVSIDFDFFCLDEFEPEQLAEHLSGHFPDFQVRSTAKNTLLAQARGVKTDLIRHAFPWIGETISFHGGSIASLRDIAAMKLSAVANRGSKKDFFDIRALGEFYSLEEMITCFRKKYENRDPFHIVRSLLYFDDAENEPEPYLLNSEPWAEVKLWLKQEVRRL